MDPERIVNGVREAEVGGADVVVVPDTALPILSIVERLEKAAGRPVLTASAVSLWGATRSGASAYRSRATVPCSPAAWDSRALRSLHPRLSLRGAAGEAIGVMDEIPLVFNVTPAAARRLPDELV